MIVDEQAAWFSLPLGDGLMAGPACADIEEKFATLFAAADKSAQRAVFKRHDTEHSLHCEVTVYFSPATRELALALGATPCARPVPRGLDLLAGDPACWSLLGEKRMA